MTAKISKPSANEVIDRGAFSYDYDVEVIWTNSSSKQLTIPYRIYIDEKPQPITAVGIPLSTTIIPFKGVAYTGTVKLGPGESVTIPVMMSWHSPFLKAWTDNIVVRTYMATQFADAWDAVSRLQLEKERLETETRAWHQAFYSSTLPAVALALRLSPVT